MERCLQVYLERNLIVILTTMGNDVANVVSPVVSHEVEVIGNAIIKHGCMKTALRDVPDGSVNLIFTDPPYLAAYLHTYGDLSRLASRILKDDGVLIAYAGKYFLPTIYQYLGSHLDYHWQIDLIHSGAASRLNKRFIHCRSKPLLVYVKKGKNRRESWIDDVLQGTGREKQLHPWQQSEEEATQLMKKLTRPGDLVVDPFLGSGTFAAAAVKLGRSFLGCDEDEKAVGTTRRRLRMLELS
jgi:DNA modification methylase